MTTIYADSPYCCLQKPSAFYPFMQELVLFSNNTTALICGHLTQQFILLTKVALLMRWLNVIFCMRSLMRKRDNMVKMQGVMRKDAFFADAAPIAVTFKNVFVTNYTSSCTFLDSLTFSSLFKVFEWVILIKGFSMLALLSTTSFSMTLAIGCLAMNSIRTKTLFISPVIVGFIDFSAFFTLIPTLFKSIEGLFCYRWRTRNANLGGGKRQLGSVVQCGHSLLSLLIRFTGLGSIRAGNTFGAASICPHYSILPPVAQVKEVC